MRILFTICFICAISLSGFGQNVRFTADDYESAFIKAKAENKLVFIDTWAVWCKPCKKQEPVFWDRGLATFFNDHFVSVKVNVESRFGKSLALKYGIVFLPTLMILDDNGNVRFRSDRSTSAALLTVDELLAIAVDVVYPKNRSTSTATAVASPPTSKPSVTAAPKLKHVQHTDLSKHKQRNETVVKAAPKPSETITTNPPEIKASDISAAKGEKILYVLGEGDDLPPEVLREEAYFRLSLMDGSHREAVKKYLISQKDWSKEENMKFLFDFLYTTRSDEFTYLIINRHKFEELYGKEKVHNSISILVNQTLQRAFPRPDQKEAQALYSYINPQTSRKKGTRYSLLKLHDEKEIDKFIPLANSYLDDIHPDDVEIMMLLANTISENIDDRKKLKSAIKLVDRSIKLRGSKFEYLDTKAFLYYKLEDKRKASETAQGAIALAKDLGVNFDSTLELLKLIEDL